MIKIELNERQLEAWNKLQDKTTEVILYGGSANSGKSWISSIFILLSALRYPGTRWALCRSTLKELKNTTLKTFFDVCKMYGIKKDIDFIINLNSNTIKFTNGSEIYLIHLEWRPSDPDADFLGGYEISGAIVDEIPQICKKYYEVLSSRIRYKLDDYNLTKKLLLTCNPTNLWVKETFYEPWLKNTLPNNMCFINTIGGKNPYRGKNYENSLSILSEQQYKRLELGDWEYASTPDQLFKPDKIEDIMSPLDHGTKGDYIISADIARKGDDKSVIVLWDGLKVIEMIKVDSDDTMVACKLISDLMNRYKIPKNKVILDQDGVGGGPVDVLRCRGFVNGGKPLKNEKYDMLRSQCYFKMANTRWSISENIKDEYKERIKKELEAVRDTSDEYVYKINSKNERKKLLNGNSPDFSDALMMRFWFLFLINNNSIKWGV